MTHSPRSAVGTRLALMMFAALSASSFALNAQAADGPTPQPEKLPLWTDAAPITKGESEPPKGSLTLHRPAEGKGNGAAVIICPGGGYGGLMMGPEGHGIAQWLNKHGVTGVVLEYRLPKGRSFVPLLDAQQAIRTVRAKAADWKLDPKKIGIMGFSAGGHLASTAGTHFDDGDSQAASAIGKTSCRPDFVVLVYPVVSMGGKTHGGSRNNLLGSSPSEDLVKLFSNELQVTDKTPPMFLAHAVDDKPVPPENSRMLYEALQAKKIPSEYLELPNGGHGLSGYKGPSWDAWQAKSLEWLAAQGFIPQKDAASGG